MMLIDEDNSATAYLSLEKLSKIIERDLSGTSQTEITAPQTLSFLPILSARRIGLSKSRMRRSWRSCRIGLARLSCVLSTFQTF